MSWRRLIEREMGKYEDGWDTFVALATPHKEYVQEGHILRLLSEHRVESFLMKEPGYHGDNFTLWTADRVYFPCNYDDQIYVGSAPRNVSPEVMEPVGCW